MQFDINDFKEIEHSRLIFGNLKRDMRMQPKTTKNKSKRIMN